MPPVPNFIQTDGSGDRVETVVGQELQKIMGKGLYMFPLMYSNYKNVAYLLFNYNDIMAGKTKSLKNKLLPIEGTVTEDGESLKWMSYNLFDTEFKVTTAMATGTTIDLNAICGSSSRGLAIGDNLTVVRVDAGASTLPNARITITGDGTSTTDGDLVSGNSIVVSPGIALNVGDKIVRNYYVQAVGEEITRGQTSYVYNHYQSYFQNFGKVLTFNKKDINKNYLIEETGVQWVRNITAYNLGLLVQEFATSVWIGRNLSPAESFSIYGKEKPEMLGILTALDQMIANDASLEHDFSSLTNDDEKIDEIMKVIELASTSGAITNGEVLTISCNQKFLSRLSALKQRDLVYNDKIEGINLSIIKFKSLYNDVEFVHEPVFDTISQRSMAVVTPRSLLSARFRENQGVIDPMTGAMEKAKGEFTFKEQIHNVHDKRIFDMYAEAGLVIGGLESGCYRKLIGL